ncbi:MAG: response regulator [Ignavibacteriales bacterium]|nr:response regulator [Ignavibacteriales bacterium]
MYKILVIDDHRDTLAVLSGFLKKEKFQVIVAESSKDGLEKAVAEEPDLILLDIMIPDMNGLDLCRILTTTPETCDIPIIFISAKITPEDVRTGFQAGAVDYVKKPIDKIELIERIRYALRRTEATELMVQQEKLLTFSATAVTANHKLKQPLTLINLSMSAIKRVLDKDSINKEEVLEKLEIIHSSVQQITAILNRLLRIQNPEIKNYLGGVKMVDIDKKSDDEVV